MAATEFRAQANGLALAGLHWCPEAGVGPPVLALHGWLDNAASFVDLAPALAPREVLALDLPGHGLSDHRLPPGAYNIWDDLLDLLALADGQQWERFDLLGHSRGALIAVLLAACMPERVRRLVLLDAVWPMPVEPAEAPAILRRYLLDQRRAAERRVPRYASFDEALAARCRVDALDREAAGHIVARGLKTLPGGGFGWRSDPRLTQGSAFKLTAAQSRAFLQAVRAPSLLLLASRGFGGRPGVLDAVEAAGLRYRLYEAHHHLHLGAVSVAVAHAVADFLAEEGAA